MGTMEAGRSIRSAEEDDAHCFRPQRARSGRFVSVTLLQPGDSSSHACSILSPLLSLPRGNKIPQYNLHRLLLGTLQ